MIHLTLLQGLPFARRFVDAVVCGFLVLLTSSIQTTGGSPVLLRNQESQEPVILSSSDCFDLRFLNSVAALWFPKIKGPKSIPGSLM